MEHGKSYPSPSCFVPPKSLKIYPYAVVGTIVGAMVYFLQAIQRSKKPGKELEFIINLQQICTNNFEKKLILDYYSLKPPNTLRSLIRILKVLC